MELFFIDKDNGAFSTGSSRSSYLNTIDVRLGYIDCENEGLIKILLDLIKEERPRECTFNILAYSEVSKQAEAQNSKNSLNEKIASDCTVWCSCL